MTKRDVLSIALRILGILGLFWVAKSLPYAVVSLTTPNETIAANDPFKFNITLYKASYMIELVLILLVSLTYLKYSDQIAGRFIKDDSSISTITTHESSRSVFTVALRIIGAYLLAIHLPDLLLGVISWVLGRFFLIAGVFQTTDLVQLIKPTLIVALGFYLLLGAKHVVGWVYKPEHVGQPL
jgi:hypothetical protein